MTIWCTPFNCTNLICTGLSVDSGFNSMDEVRASMGEPLNGINPPGIAIYGGHPDRVIFSKVPYKLEKINADEHAMDVGTTMGGVDEGTERTAGDDGNPTPLQ